MASIVGLHSQADALQARFTEISTTLAGSLRIAKELRNQLICCRNSIGDFQAQIDDSRLSPERAALIPADELVTSFTNALLLFSEVHRTVGPLISSPDDPSKWYDSQTKLVDLLERLWAQDLVWKLLLDVLTW